MGDFLLSKPILEPTEPLVCPPKPNLKKSSQTLKQTRFDPTLEGKHEKHNWCDDLEHALACMDLYQDCYDFEEMKKNDFKLVVEIMAGINNDTKIIWEIKECPIWCDDYECKNDIGLIIVGASVGSLILISVISVIVVMVRLNKSKGR